MLALSFLVMIGLSLVVEGWDAEKSEALHLKNYIYFGMAFSFLVEILNMTMMKKNKRITGIVLLTAFILLIPFTAMQFSDEVNWSLSDFILAGGLLLGTGFMCELVLRKVQQTRLRIAICLTLLVILLLIWAELAVGIFGTPFSGS